MFQDKGLLLLEQKLYLVGIIAGIVLAVLIATGLLPKFVYILPRCDFHMFTGMYCPGCGGTRAAIAFLNGHLIKAFLYHPFVPYCAIMYIVFMLKGTLAILSKGKFCYMKLKNSYIFLGIAIILIQFIIKDVLLLMYGIDILES